MAAETIPPEVVAMINNMRRRIADLERRLLTQTAASAKLTPTDFTCFDTTEIVGSIAVWVTQGSASGCASGFRGTGYVPIFIEAD